MKIRIWFFGSSFLALMLFGQIALARPAVFSDYSLSKAKEQAKAKKKFLLIDFTAEWCGPCKRMDGSAWNDPKVMQWVKENAIAIQLDVDKESDAASELKVRALPTIVVFSSNDIEKEFDRHVGYKDTDEVLSWLNSIQAGKSSLILLKEKTQGDIKKGGRAAVEARYKLAEELLDSGSYAEATEQYVWLWKNIPTENPAMVGLRSSFMARKMEQLAKEYPDAKKQFSEIRDQAKQLPDLHDWIVLCEHVLGESKTVIDWFDSIKEDPKQQRTVDQNDYMIIRILQGFNRWADIGKYLYKDPIAKLQECYKLAQDIKELEKKAAPGQEVSDFFPTDAASIYVALLAAGREEDASKVAKKSFELSNTPHMRFELVSVATEAKQFRPQHLKWLEGATPDKDGAGEFYILRAQLRFKAGDFTNALKDYDTAISSGDSTKEAYIGRAQVYDKLGNTDLANRDRKLAETAGNE